MRVAVREADDARELPLDLGNLGRRRAVRQLEDQVVLVGPDVGVDAKPLHDAVHGIERSGHHEPATLRVRVHTVASWHRITAIEAQRELVAAHDRRLVRAIIPRSPAAAVDPIRDPDVSLEGSDRAARRGVLRSALANISAAYLPMATRSPSTHFHIHRSQPATEPVRHVMSGGESIEYVFHGSRAQLVMVVTT